jgi:response regulator NasT
VTTSYRVLLLDRNPGRAALLEEALAAEGYQVVSRLAPGIDLQAEVERARPDLVIIDMDSPDRDTLEHLGTLNRNNPKPVLMFADASDRDTMRAAIRAGVSAYVVDGFSPGRLRSVMELAIARFEDYQGLRGELEDARAKLADRRDVEKAKGLLMQRRRLTEDEAHRALRKMAMDRNLTFGDAARALISALELLG